MADFCQQCCIDMWGSDTGDLKAGTSDTYQRLLTICEGCGPTVVDRSGKCLGQCLKRHGTEPVLTIKDFTK